MPLEDKQGMACWFVSLAVAGWCCHPSTQELLRGKEVLEIGAGCALPGLVAARVARRVVITDFEDPVLDNMKISAQLNTGGAAHVEVEKLDFEQPPTKFWNSFDVVIGAEVLFDGLSAAVTIFDEEEVASWETHETVARTLRHCLRRPAGQAFLFGTDRDEDSAKFITHAETMGLRVTRRPLSSVVALAADDDDDDDDDDDGDDDGKAPNKTALTFDLEAGFKYCLEVAWADHDDDRDDDDDRADPGGLAS